MLDTLKLEDFSNRVDEVFEVALGEHRLTAKLRSATGLTKADPDDEVARQPFSLILRVECDVELPQGVYSLQHGELGGLEAFLVPVGEHEKGYDLEAVFN